jgi:hypothetical protein
VTAEVEIDSALRIAAGRGPHGSTGILSGGAKGAGGTPRLQARVGAKETAPVVIDDASATDADG